MPLDLRAAFPEQNDECTGGDSQPPRRRAGRLLHKPRRVVETIADGAVAHDKDSATALLLRAERAVAEQVVVEPYLIQVTHKDDGDILPVRYREAIRALGPSVRPDIVTDRSGRSITTHFGNS